MIKAERTTKIDLKAKGLCITDDSIIEVDTGEEIDLVEKLKNIFGTSPFDLSVTKSEKEEIEEVEDEEVDIDELTED